MKETLRWDTRENVVNKELENIIMKTVAAFSNRYGGTLIIGVMDKGEVVGIENDYKTLDSGDKDKFELHLTNLFQKFFGK